MAYYYRDYGGPAIGPASEAEVKELARRGIISPTTEVRVGMSPKWFSVTKVPGIRFAAPIPDEPDETSTEDSTESVNSMDSTVDPSPSAVESGPMVESGPNSTSDSQPNGNTTIPLPWKRYTIAIVIWTLCAGYQIWSRLADGSLQFGMPRECALFICLLLPIPVMILELWSMATKRKKRLSERDDFPSNEGR